MTAEGKRGSRTKPGKVDRAVSVLNGWVGGYLSQTQNGLHQPMAFYKDNRPQAPEDFPEPPTGKVCVLVHGLSCNESSWSFPESDDGAQESALVGKCYGSLLENSHGHMPLYLRFNTGLRISDNGQQLADLLERFCKHQGSALTELMLIGHSMGGLVIRSACHQASEANHSWVSHVRQIVYLGSPHLGAPLEKATNVASHALNLIDTTATRIIREVLNTRSPGIKDLRFGNLVDEDWLDYDPDELLKNRRVPIPWLATARHYRVVGQAVPRAKALGDAMVLHRSASGAARGSQPGAPDLSDVQIMPGLDHLTLARHPAVYEHIERWASEDA